MLVDERVASAGPVGVAGAVVGACRDPGLSTVPRSRCRSRTRIRRGDPRRGGDHGEEVGLPRSVRVCQRCAAPGFPRGSPGGLWWLRARSTPRRRRGAGRGGGRRRWGCRNGRAQPFNGAVGATSAAVRQSDSIAYLLMGGIVVVVMVATPVARACRTVLLRCNLVMRGGVRAGGGHNCCSSWCLPPVVGCLTAWSRVFAVTIAGYPSWGG